MSETAEPWYAAKTVYYYLGEDVYEERLVIHRASSFEEAWDKNKKETSKYIKVQAHAGFTIELIKTIEIYHIFDEKIESGSEVFSTMRRVHSTREKFLEMAYESGMDYKL